MKRRRNDGDELTGRVVRYRVVGESVLEVKKGTSSIGNRSSRSVAEQRRESSGGGGGSGVRDGEKKRPISSREIAFLQFLGGLSAPSTADCRYR